MVSTVEPMTFYVLSLFPELFENLGGLVEQARQKKHIQVHTLNPREFTHDTHQSVDSTIYGGAPGMLMQFEPLKKSIEHLKQQHQNIGPVVLLSPQGQRWTHSKAEAWARKGEPITLVCARYAGVDERFIRTYVDVQISIGDFILTGGEWAAMVVIDSVARFVDGVLGHNDSNKLDSFSSCREGGLLQEPQFTRPAELSVQNQKLKVPDVLRSGHAERVRVWRHNMSLLKTLMLRPDLVADHLVAGHLVADHLVASHLVASHALPKHELLQWLKAQPDSELELCGLNKEHCLQALRRL